MRHGPCRMSLRVSWRSSRSLDQRERGAQADHLEIHLQRRRVPDPARSVRAAATSPGGVAPMSLMTYEEAFPWAESIRAELVAAHMPPWHADEAFGELKQRAHAVAARSSTSSSRGRPAATRAARSIRSCRRSTLKNEWTMGAPDLALPLPAEFTLAADKMDDTQEFTIADRHRRKPRWVRAVDLLPGTPSIVRSATIYVKGDAAAPEPAGAGA